MRMLFLAGVLSVVVAFSGQEPPEYPDGMYCSPKGDITVNGQVLHPDHKCLCHREDHSQDCEGEPTHDSQCKQWCHENHCRCPIMCKHTQVEQKP